MRFIRGRYNTLSRKWFGKKKEALENAEGEETEGMVLENAEGKGEEGQETKKKKAIADHGPSSALYAKYYQEQTSFIAQNKFYKKFSYVVLAVFLCVIIFGVIYIAAGKLTVEGSCAEILFDLLGFILVLKIFLNRTSHDPDQLESLKIFSIGLIALGVVDALLTSYQKDDEDAVSFSFTFFLIRLAINVGFWGIVSIVLAIYSRTVRTYKEELAKYEALVNINP